MVTRINKESGVIEESGLGIFWDAKRDDNDQMTRINANSGVLEESGWGIFWDSKRDNNDNIARVNTETGDIEHSHYGICWDSESKARETSSSGSGYSGSTSSTESSDDQNFPLFLVLGGTLFIAITPFLLTLFYLPTLREHSSRSASNKEVSVSDDSLLSLSDMFSQQINNVISLCIGQKIEGEIHTPIFQDLLVAIIIEVVCIFLLWLCFH